MTVEFYVHTGQIEDMNERRAICRMARVLESGSFNLQDLYLFIANIDPDKDPELREQGKLTQLDGLLLGPNVIAIVDFKNYFDPIETNDLNGKWYVRTRQGRQLVKGGSYKNPYYQARRARQLLHDYLRRFDPTLFSQIPDKSWEAIYAFVLFHPALHPRSKIPDLGKDDYWLRFSSVGDIAVQAFTAGPAGFSMSSERIRDLAKKAFRAEPWQDMSRLLQDEVGYLMVQESGDATPLRIPVWHYDDFTIGRSSKYGHRLKLIHEKVSRAHVRVTVEDNRVRIYDLGSKNGIFIDGRRVDSKSGQILSSVAHLGGPDGDTAKIWFYEATAAFGRTASTQ